MLADETDEALMVRYQEGQAKAFEVLLGRHRRPIFNFILRYVGLRDVAEDLVQETFLRVIKAAGSYRAQAKFTTWLYTIARNLCTDQSRRAKHRKARSLDAPLSNDAEAGTLQDVIPSDEPGAERGAMDAQFRGVLASALASLSEEQREVFLMRELSGMPFREIAEVVGAPENTVKSRMRYALEKLREVLVDLHRPSDDPPLEPGSTEEVSG